MRELADRVAGYFQWLKAMTNDVGLQRLAIAGNVDIRVVALVISLAGANGRGCLPKGETIAGQVGCSRKTAEKYRKELIDLGWLAVMSRTGGKNHRSLVVDIALPEFEACSSCGLAHDPWETCSANLPPGQCEAEPLDWEA